MSVRIDRIVFGWRANNCVCERRMRIRCSGKLQLSTSNVGARFGRYRDDATWRAGAGTSRGLANRSKDPSETSSLADHAHYLENHYCYRISTSILFTMFLLQPYCLNTSHDDPMSTLQPFSAERQCSSPRIRLRLCNARSAVAPCILIRAVHLILFSPTM